MEWNFDPNGDQSGKPNNKTFTPADRGIWPKWRTKRIKEQAADFKLTTEMTIGAMMGDYNAEKL